MCHGLSRPCRFAIRGGVLALRLQFVMLGGFAQRPGLLPAIVQLATLTRTQGYQ